MITLDPIELVISDVRAGKLVVIVDDRDRENEGDLMIAAQSVTAESLNFMIQEGRGLICLSLTAERLEALGVPLQVAENTSSFGTNFTMSLDHRSVSHQGVSASARAETILQAINPHSVAQDFVVPGFVFPLLAREGGVLQRRGQTEGSVDLAILAGLKPAGVICEVMGADGQMLRGKALEQFCRTHKLRITSVEEIVQYRLQNEVSLRRTSEAVLKGVGSFSVLQQWWPGRAEGQLGDLKVISYVDDVDGKEQLAFVRGEPRSGCLVRIHSECLTGDVFSSRRCDCGFQFAEALTQIIFEGEGILIYLFQEGRGIGLGNKLRAYELQEQGRDTVDANVELGFEADSRDYRSAAKILTDLGVSTVRLMTNNPDKVSSLENFGIQVKARVPLQALPDVHNISYLQTKRDRMGHLLPSDLKL